MTRKSDVTKTQEVSKWLVSIGIIISLTVSLNILGFAIGMVICNFITNPMYEDKK